MSDDRKNEPVKPDIREVVALEAGHDGLHYQPAGARFMVDFNDPRLKDATWFAEPEKVPEPKAKPTDKRPPGAGPIKGSAVKNGENPAG